MGHAVTFEKNGSSVTMDVWHDGKTGSIELVSSKYKKRGLATTVMHKACEYADYLDIELVLTISPFGDERTQMDKPELRAWYMTFGFLYEGDDVMSRMRATERVEQ